MCISLPIAPALPPVPCPAPFSWLFRVRTNRTSSGWAVVKVWCVPVQKVKQRGLAMCTPKKVFSQVRGWQCEGKGAPFPLEGGWYRVLQQV